MSTGPMTRSRTKTLEALAHHQRNPTLTGLPAEVRSYIWKNFFPRKTVLQINPDAGPNSIPNGVFTCQQLCRLATVSAGYTQVNALKRVPFTNQFEWHWEDSPRQADHLVNSSWYEWCDSVQNGQPNAQGRPHTLNDDILNARLTSRTIMQEILDAARHAQIPVMLTCPGVPDLNRLNPWQQGIVNETQNLIFRYGAFDCVPLSPFLQSCPNVDNLIVPTQYMIVDYDLSSWSGPMLAYGIQCEDPRAHQYLQNAFQSVLPGLLRLGGRAHTLRWIGEIIVENMSEWPDPDDPNAGPESGALRCIVGRNVTNQAEHVEILGAEYIRDWNQDCFDMHDMIKLADRYRQLEAHTAVDWAQPTVYTGPRQIAARLLGDISVWDGNNPAQLAARHAMNNSFGTWIGNNPIPAGVPDLRQAGGCDEGGFFVANL